MLNRRLTESDRDYVNRVLDRLARNHPFELNQVLDAVAVMDDSWASCLRRPGPEPGSKGAALKGIASRKDRA